MPFQANRLCPACRTLTKAGERCATCRRDASQRRGTSTERGYNIHWQRRRALGLSKEPLCRICFEVLGLVVRATTRDHIVPRARVERMMRAICKACVSHAIARRVTETMKSFATRCCCGVGRDLSQLTEAFEPIGEFGWTDTPLVAYPDSGQILSSDQAL